MYSLQERYILTIRQAIRYRYLDTDGYGRSARHASINRETAQQAVRYRYRRKDRQAGR